MLTDAHRFGVHKVACTGQASVLQGALGTPRNSVPAERAHARMRCWPPERQPELCVRRTEAARRGRGAAGGQPRRGGAGPGVEPRVPQRAGERERGPHRQGAPGRMPARAHTLPYPTLHRALSPRPPRHAAPRPCRPSARRRAHWWGAHLRGGGSLLLAGRRHITAAQRTRAPVWACAARDGRACPRPAQRRRAC